MYSEEEVTMFYQDILDFGRREQVSHKENMNGDYIRRIIRENVLKYEPE